MVRSMKSHNIDNRAMLSIATDILTDLPLELRAYQTKGIEPIEITFFNHDVVV